MPIFNTLTMEATPAAKESAKDRKVKNTGLEIGTQWIILLSLSGFLS